MFETLLIFLMTNQPTTFSYCVARCELLASFMHTLAKHYILHCLNGNHFYIFIEEVFYLTRQF